MLTHIREILSCFTAVPTWTVELRASMKRQPMSLSVGGVDVCSGHISAQDFLTLAKREKPLIDKLMLTFGFCNFHAIAYAISFLHSKKPCSRSSRAIKPYPSTAKSNIKSPPFFRI